MEEKSLCSGKTWNRLNKSFSTGSTRQNLSNWGSTVIFWWSTKQSPTGKILVLKLKPSFSTYTFLKYLNYSFSFSLHLLSTYQLPQSFNGLNSHLFTKSSTYLKLLTMSCLIHRIISYRCRSLENLLFFFQMKFSRMKSTSVQLGGRLQPPGPLPCTFTTAS